MKKNAYRTNNGRLKCFLKILMISKCILLLVLACSLQAFSKGYSQNRINVTLKNASLKKALKEIERKTDYRFVYNDDVLNAVPATTVAINDASLKDAMNALLNNTSLEYHLSDDNLVIISAKGTIVADVVITGTVVDEQGDPLPGASVSLKGTTIGAQTDVNGKFKLNITGNSANAVLLVRFVGYKQQEIPVGSKTVFTIKMVSDAVQLNEVVAIGYATVNRRDLTGSVSSVNAKQLKDIPINSAAEALAGRLAGVQVTGSEGSPDAQVSIRVRGGGSVTQDNSPLYIIDGVQVENGLNTLSPQDIETIDVLKDAASTSIYGARGSNGVVIITTKGGHEMKTTVSYNGFVGVSHLAKELPVLSPYDFVVYQYERSRGNATDSTSFASLYGNNFGALASYQDTAAVDWQKLVFDNTAFQQTHNVSVAGGDKTTTFNASFTNNHQSGIVLNTGLDRNLINFRFDHTASEKFRLGFNARYNDQQANGAGVSSADAPTSNLTGSTYNNLRSTVKYEPFTSGGLPPGTFNSNYFNITSAAGNNLGLIDPIVLANAQYRNTHTTDLNINGYVNYSFTKFLSFKSTLGYDFNNVTLNSFDDYLTPNAQINGGGQPMAGVNLSATNTVDFSNVLTFTNAAFHPIHNNVTLLAGTELYNITLSGTNNQYKGFPIGISPSNALNQLQIGVPLPGYPAITNSISHLFSVFGRANYSYDSKYLASFSLRTDASSKFNTGQQYGYFPSGSLAWRISDEKFMKSLPTISDLKLRVSYGTSGNNRIPDYQTQTVFNATSVYYLNGSSTPTTGFNTPYLANPDLKWETTYSENIGLDIGLFKGRLQASFDAYNNHTKNLLIQVPIPTSSGYATQLQNVGETQNKGLEAQLSGTILQKKDFMWSANFNISFNVNKVVALAPGETSYLQSSGWGVSGQPADFIVQVGQPIGSIYGYQSDGYYTTNDFNYNPANNQYTLKAGAGEVDPSKIIGTPMPGMIKYKVTNPNPTLNANGNPVLSTADQTIIGNTLPQITGGLNQQFTYKNFDASIFVNFQARAQVLNANKVEFTNGYTAETNLLGQEANRWRTIDGNGNVVEKIVTPSGGSAVAVGASPDVLNALNAGATVPIPVTGSAAFYPTSSAVESAAFIRINNITLGYRFAPKLLQAASIKSLRIYVTGNNLGIITPYSGYDPEVNTRRATPVTPGVDYSAYPRSRTYIMGVQLSL